MNAIVEHLQQHLYAYVALAVGLSIFVYATRRYSLPIIQYALEVAIYCGFMHIIVWCITNGAAAFKRASSFKALASDRENDATWTTPLLRFWEMDKYDPHWIARVEMVAVALIIILVYRLRPMKIQKSTRSTAPMSRRIATAPGARGAKSFGRAGGGRRK